MSDNPWFRFYSKFITDPDVEELSFDDQRHYIFILCLKCNGLLDKEFTSPAKRDRMISRRLGIHGEAFEQAKVRLVESGLVDPRLNPRSWDDLQFKSDSSKERVAKHRAKRRGGDVTVTLQKRHSNALEQNRTEQNIEKLGRKSSTAGFDEFWQAYPKKVKRKTALEIWKRKKPDAGVLIADIKKRMQYDKQWRDGFIPHATTYLNGERWHDAIEGELTMPTRKPRKPEVVTPEMIQADREKADRELADLTARNKRA